MKKISDAVYQQIDNSIYDSDQIEWWQKDNPINLMESILNPVRFDYFKNILTELNVNPKGKEALEVGCGGGLLSEEIARTGFKTAGMDPSEKSLRIAKEHARRGDLLIDYLKGYGEEIPFPDHSFDVVFCCDVLEHVRDQTKVIREISRVLKKGGLFFYDTMNRTLLSKLVVIKIMQEWSYFSILPSRLHVWEMFIRPDEMKEILISSGLLWKEHRGIRNNSPVVSILLNMHRRAVGKLSCTGFGERCKLKEGSSLAIAYMGYAVKL